MFDIEEYRADLQRRADTLGRMEDQYYQKYSVSARAVDYDDWMRCQNKRRGIEIALSLLPKPGEVEEIPLVPEYFGGDRTTKEIG
jgi:hypothetical protein